MLLFCLLLSLFKLSNHTILHPSLHTLKAKAILRHCASDHIFLSLFLKNILKFNLWLCWVWTFPSCGEPWLLLFGPWALQRGFSSGEPAARGIFPDQGWDPCPLQWRVDSYPLYHQGRPLLLFQTPLSPGGRAGPGGGGSERSDL